jgi:hypothetical protein
MKAILFLLCVSSFLYAGDSNIVCEDRNDEYVDSKYIDFDTEETVTIEFHDLFTDKYSFEVSFDPKTRNLSYKVYEMNSWLLIEERSQKVGYYDQISFVSGYKCQLTD